MRELNGPSPSSLERRVPVSPWLRVRWQLLSLPILAFTTVPLLAILLYSSPADVWQRLGDPVVLQAVGVSLKTTFTALIAIIIFGTPAAYLLSRRRFPSQRLVDTLIDLPTILPPSVAGLGLLLAFGRRGLFGPLVEGLGVEIAFTQAAVVMAQVFVATPYYIKSAALGFAGIDPELEQAASLDGAGTRQMFRYIIAPLAWRALISGSVMSWARALGEFGATIIFAGNFPGRTQTMPLAIYLGFELDIEVAITLSVILLLFSFLVLMLVKGVLVRGE